jgi:catechol 2,3-dioxygenase-like lactoylglutathione lyase family enzyme
MTSEPPEAEPTAGHGPRLTSVVIFVHDLDESARFYCELLRMEVAVRQTSAVLLTGADGAQVYVRAIGAHGEHPMGAVGIQYAIWTAHDADDLLRCENFLKDRSAHVATDTGEGFTLVEGRDPNGLPVMVSYPGPDRTARREIMTRIYAW